ncbi:MAG: helix-turn-helix domain-containing protein [Chloroflexota bacterium]
MSFGSKYHPLFEYLQQLDSPATTLTFSEIEGILGRGLPKSARRLRGWWSNRDQGAVQATAWMKAGYHVYELDIENEKVTFRKPTAIYRVERDGDTVMWDGDLIRTLRYHMGSSQSELAEELGVRQQTISEWETGMYRPKRAMSKYLMIIAERAGFTYDIDETVQTHDASDSDDSQSSHF